MRVDGRLTESERRGIKFGGGFLGGVFLGCLFAAVFTNGRPGVTVAVGSGAAVALGLLAAAVSDES